MKISNNFMMFTVYLLTESRLDHKLTQVLLFYRIEVDIQIDQAT
jgi:hypothetical protein